MIPGEDKVCLCFDSTVTQNIPGDAIDDTGH